MSKYYCKKATMYEDDIYGGWHVVVGDSEGDGYIEKFMFKSDAELFLKTFDGMNDVQFTVDILRGVLHR